MKNKVIEDIENILSKLDDLKNKVKKQLKAQYDKGWNKAKKTGKKASK